MAQKDTLSYYDYDDEEDPADTVSEFVVTQYLKNEFYLNYGVFSQQQQDWTMGYTYNMDRSNSESPIKTRESSNFGPIFIGYNRYVTSKLSVGLIAGYSRHSINASFFNVNDVSDGQLKYYMIMPSCDYKWFNKIKIQLSSGVSLGYAYTDFSSQSQDMSAKTSPFVYQINVIGIRVGGEIGLSMQLGYGYLGIFNIGLSSRF